jgi:GTP-binding protein
MLTDEVKIKVSAGKGGDGLVTFDKVKMSLGPTGGRGGNGGSVYFQSVTNLTALNKYRNKKDWWAKDGQKGKADRMDGHNGEDLVLTVPVGTLVHNLDTGEKIDITRPEEKVLAVKGGIGGRGNFFFRSPTNTTPYEYEEGESGETFNFLLELRLIADIGLVGFPNAGKSSLLNELTKADVKVANYEFTTLEPNLGAMDGLIIADIPGLIEGASRGRGLGIKFLRHIARTKILAHCISLESKNIKKDYATIHQELKEFNKELVDKKEIVILTKSDLISRKELVEKMKEAKKLNPDVIAVSVHDWDSLQILKNNLKI